MSLIETIISVLGGGVIGYFVKYYLDLRLAKQSEVMARKRAVYEEIAMALGIFVSGRDIAPSDKKKFLECSSKIWLWASDSVVRTGNKFIDVMISFDKSCDEEQNKAKRSYGSFIIEMRKDLGFPKTNLKPDEYRFTSFMP
ncbi:MAG: hypothetical protein WC476_03230 [Phycisphaerae bacterium]|jgi:hypothetical protein